MAHLALLTTSFANGNPGSEAAGSFVADFAAVLAEHLQVTIVAPSDQTNAATVGQLTVQRFAVPRLPLSSLKPGNPTHWGDIARTLYAGQKAIERLVRTKDIDHILALWVLPSGYWARRVWKRYGVPYSVWALGSDIWGLHHIPLVKRALTIALNDAHVCYADGILLKEQVEKLSGRDCQFLPSTRDLPLTQTKSLRDAPPYRLAYLGRWHPNKGVDLLLESLALLSEADWHKIEEVRICGGGPLDGLVKRRVRALQALNKPVLLQGYMDKRQAAYMFAHTDYLIVPSRIESIPVVFSDAVKANVPLIATPVGDLPRLLNEYKVGVLARAPEARALVCAIGSALEHPPGIYVQGLTQAKEIFNLRGITKTFLSNMKI